MPVTYVFYHVAGAAGGVKSYVRNPQPGGVPWKDFEYTASIADALKVTVPEVWDDQQGKFVPGPAPEAPAGHAVELIDPRNLVSSAATKFAYPSGA